MLKGNPGRNVPATVNDWALTLISRNLFLITTFLINKRFVPLRSYF